MFPRMTRVNSEKHHLTKVAVQRSEQAVTVVMEADQPMTYQVMPIDAFRLILDLKNVQTTLKFQELSVDHLLLSRIRIGRHPNKLRMVFDLNMALNKDLKYAVKARGSQLAVRLVKM